VNNMEKFKIQFELADGTFDTIEVKTDRGLEWTINQYSRNRNVINYKLVL